MNTDSICASSLRVHVYTLYNNIWYNFLKVVWALRYNDYITT
jgi:hypothetical protein